MTDPCENSEQTARREEYLRGNTHEAEVGPVLEFQNPAQQMGSSLRVNSFLPPNMSLLVGCSRFTGHH